MSTSYNLEIKDEAKLDIREAYDWYEEQLADLGKTFEKSLNKAIRSILKTPTGYKHITDSQRQIPLKKFPFVIIYEVFDNTIVVFAVFHTSQNPEKKPS
ncbi:MAG: plasmid stabilization system protein ParE [Crocinitomicaceae bacterium]|jgi:plasmid stabilization system protein ParE